MVNKDSINNVCIVWVAKSPNRGRVIIGWYKNAKVYDKPKHLLNNGNGNPDIIDYWFEAKKDYCTLIPEEERNFPYPSGKGFMSTSPYTYADASSKDYNQNEIEVVQNYVQSVINFINNYEKLPKEQISFLSDLARIENSKETTTTKKQLVNARLGQGKYRKDLLLYGGECPVTKVKLESLLKASHIKALEC